MSESNKGTRNATYTYVRKYESVNYRFRYWFSHYEYKHKHLLFNVWISRVKFLSTDKIIHTTFFRQLWICV